MASERFRGVLVERKESTMSSQHPWCPRCGGRLFRESESRGNRLIYFWECTLGCSRQWSLDGEPMAKAAGEQGSRKRAYADVPVYVTA